MPKLLLKDFETTFQFNITPMFREFLLEHNGGAPASGVFPTAVKERKLARMMDFSDRYSVRGAWAINRRLRGQIGEKRIIIGIDSLDNFICLERHYRHQTVVVWNHLTGEFEESRLDLPALLRCLG